MPCSPMKFARWSSSSVQLAGSFLDDACERSLTSATAMSRPRSLARRQKTFTGLVSSITVPGVMPKRSFEAGSMHCGQVSRNPSADHRSRYRLERSRNESGKQGLSYGNDSRRGGSETPGRRARSKPRAADSKCRARQRLGVRQAELDCVSRAPGHRTSHYSHHARSRLPPSTGDLQQPASAALTS